MRAGKLHRQRLETDVSLTGFSQNEVRVKESREDRQEQEEKGRGGRQRWEKRSSEGLSWSFFFSLFLLSCAASAVNLSRPAKVGFTVLI